MHNNTQIRKQLIRPRRFRFIDDGIIVILLRLLRIPCMPIGDSRSSTSQSSSLATRLFIAAAFFNDGQQHKWVMCPMSSIVVALVNVLSTVYCILYVISYTVYSTRCTRLVSEFATMHTGVCEDATVSVIGTCTMMGREGEVAGTHRISRTSKTYCYRQGDNYTLLAV